MNGIGLFSKQSIKPGFFRGLLRFRFNRFGLVGVSGMVVNLAVLYIGQEVLFNGLESENLRLNLSLGLAIFLATVNNYIWNRIWTWGDRKRGIRNKFFLQMGQYFLACGLAISLQFLFTRLLVQIAHYLLANVFAIVLAAFVNFVINDIWTFAVAKKKRPCASALTNVGLR